MPRLHMRLIPRLRPTTRVLAAALLTAALACTAHRASAQSDSLLVPTDEEFFKRQNRTSQSVREKLTNSTRNFISYCTLLDMPEGITEERIGISICGGYFFRVPLGNYFAVVPGYMISQDNFYFNVASYQPDTLLSIGFGNEFGFAQQNFARVNKLRQYWVEIPLELEVHSRPNEDGKSRLRLSVGGQIGFQIDAMRKFKFDDNTQVGQLGQQGTFKSKRTLETDNLNKVRYGLRGGVAVGHFGLQAVYMLSDLLKTNPDGHAPRSLALGVMYHL